MRRVVVVLAVVMLGGFGSFLNAGHPSVVTAAGIYHIIKRIPIPGDRAGITSPPTPITAGCTFRTAPKW